MNYISSRDHFLSPHLIETWRVGEYCHAGTTATTTYCRNSTMVQPAWQYSPPAPLGNSTRHRPDTTWRATCDHLQREYGNLWYTPGAVSSLSRRPLT